MKKLRKPECAFLEGAENPAKISAMVQAINSSLGETRALYVHKEGDTYIIDGNIPEFAGKYSKYDLWAHIKQFRIHWCAIYDPTKGEYVRL